ncbi:MAG TPA: thiol:disulfide interchange protein DsbA/DsbL [Steroidobacteraceae bacterium]|nr:thiol:disulfide interchange protein DsbA/DsbL [Steroidobacteraceae bacterium]
MPARRLLFLALLLACMPALAQLRWQQGVDYQLLPGGQRAGSPADKIEVAEVFSYGCPYCYKAKDPIAKLAATLPADAVMTYVHASFQPAEDWPMLQRAYYTAKKLGIAAASHEAMFDAIWKTGEIPLVDTATGQLRRPLPTIEAAAKFYARVGKVTVTDFVNASNSPQVDAAIQRAEELIKLWHIPGTPSLVVNGRYLVSNDLPFAEQAQIVQYLIGLERARLKQK